MPRRKTHDEFVVELQQTNNTVIVLGKYQNCKTKIKCKCSVCGFEWKAIPSNLLRGTGCPPCGRKKSDLAKKKTHEQFISELKNVNSNITILSRYTLDNEKVHCKCNICGFKWMATASNLLQGKGCKQCHYIQIKKDRTKPNDIFISEMSVKNPTLEAMEPYRGTNEKIQFKCKIHGTTGHMMPGKALYGQTFCKKCYIEKNIKNLRKTNKEFLEELRLANPDILPLDEYRNSHSKILVKCLKCGVTWEASPHYLLNDGSHCVSCSRMHSKGENIISKYLTQKNISFIIHKTFPDLKGIGGKSLSYDFYIPNMNMLLEYQGEYHDGTAANQTDKGFSIQQEHDRRKRNYAQSSGYDLYEIWYYDDIYSELARIFSNIPVEITA